MPSASALAKEERKAFKAVSPLSIALVLVVVLVYLGVWRIGSVMLQLTGMDARKASFQALSALTQTGFTTREAELVVSHDQRRRIVSSLIIFGHAGFAAVVAVLVQSLLSKNPLELAWRVVLLVLLGVLVYFLAVQRGINRKVTELIRRRLQRTSAARHLACEEMLHLAEGYGVAEIHLGPQHGPSLAERTLAQLNLTARGVLILAIQHPDSSLLPAPTSSSLLNLGDTIICYGKIDSIRHLAHQPDEFLHPRRRRATRATRSTPRRGSPGAKE